MDSKNPSLKSMIKTGGFLRNPVLVQVIGICPVAAAATSLINALALSVIFTLSLIFCEVVASLLLKKVSRWIRMGLYAVMGVIILFPIIYLFERYTPAIFSSLGIYLPLMAMSSFNCVHCEKFAVKNSVKMSFYDAIASSVGYCAILIAVGIFREVLGNGTLLGFPLPLVKGLYGLLLPFGGLLIIGMLAAFHRSRLIKNHPDMVGDEEWKFVLDESDDKEATFTYALKNRFRKKS